MVETSNVDKYEVYQEMWIVLGKIRILSKKKSAVRCPMFDPGPSRQQNLVKSYMGIGAKCWPTDPWYGILHVFPRIPFEKW